MKISCCIIAKDEEDNIADCIKSVVDIVDEIIVLDTGSNDDTIKISESFDKVKVYETKWYDDNSKARNECTSYATGDWILILDADEKLDYQSGLKLKQSIEEGNFDNADVIKCKYINENPFSLTKTHFKSSLFRNNKKIKYIMPIHDFPIKENGDTKYVLDNQIKIIHNNGRTLSFLQPKAENYIIRINKELKKNLSLSDLAFYYGHLGDAYSILRDNDKALKYYNQAEDIAKKIKYSNKNSFIYNLGIRKAQVVFATSLITLLSCQAPIENNIPQKDLLVEKGKTFTTKTTYYKEDLIPIYVTDINGFLSPKCPVGLYPPNISPTPVCKCGEQLQYDLYIHRLMDNGSWINECKYSTNLRCEPVDDSGCQNNTYVNVAKDFRKDENTYLPIYSPANQDSFLDVISIDVTSSESSFLSIEDLSGNVIASINTDPTVGSVRWNGRYGNGNIWLDNQTPKLDETQDFVSDGKYIVKLNGKVVNNRSDVRPEILIDNTPPVIKKTDIDSNGNLQITAYDPTVNLISSGLEKETKDLRVDYGKNKRENIQLSVVKSQMGISSLTATDTSKILKKGTFSAEIKDKVGNIFKYNNNCATDGEAKKKEVEDKLKPLKNIIEQNLKEVNNLKVKFEATLQEYNSLVTQGKALDSTLTQLETQLNLSQQKLDELNANNEDDLADEYEQLTKTTEMLAEQAKEANNQISKINNQLDNKSKNLDELKNKINQAKSEVEASNNQVNNLLNSLDGVCLASALGTAIGQFVGPLGPVVIAVDRTIDAALIINSMYVNSLIAENKAYSQQEAQKSKNLRERVAILAKESKKSGKEAGSDVPSEPYHYP